MPDIQPATPIVMPVPSAAPTAAFLADIAGAAVPGYTVEVTPHMAAQWLRANIDNRPVRSSHITTLVDEIRSGRWRVTHQGIAFSSKGRLIDGQHRLHAIIVAGQPVWLTVFVGLDDDMFGALDRGIRRTIADELLLNPRTVEPCTWIARLFRRGDRRPPSPAEVSDIVELYQAELQAVQEAASGVARRTAAGLRAALLIRLYDANTAEKTLLLTQWKAFANLDTTIMDDTCGALLRRLTTISKNYGNVIDERGAVGWNAFNPRARTLKKIIIRDIGTELDEMRSAVERHRRDRPESRDVDRMLRQDRNPAQRGRRA
jgi:hypothetical protein